MLKITPNDVVNLVKIANQLDEVGEVDAAEKITKVAENMLYIISQPSSSDRQAIMTEIISELDKDLSLQS